MEVQGEKGIDSMSHNWSVVESGSKTRTNPKIHRVGASLFQRPARNEGRNKTQKREHPPISKGVGP